MKLKYITEPLEKFVTRRKNAETNYTITTIHCPLCNEPNSKREFEDHVFTRHSQRVDECFAKLFGLPWPARCACGHELKYSRKHKGFPKTCGACQTGTQTTLEFTSSVEAEKHIEQLKALLDKAKEEKKRLETEEKLTRIPLEQLPFPTRKNPSFLTRLAMAIRVNVVNGETDKLKEIANVIDKMVLEA